MLLNCKQCHKNVNEWCLHFNACQVFILTFKMVLMTLMFAFMKVYDHWPIWMPQSVIECWLKCKNRNWIWYLRKCSYFRTIGRRFTQMIAYFVVMNSKRCNNHKKKISKNSSFQELEDEWFTFKIKWHFQAIFM